MCLLQVIHSAEVSGVHPKSGPRAAALASAMRSGCSSSLNSGRGDTGSVVLDPASLLAGMHASSYKLHRYPEHHHAYVPLNNGPQGAVMQASAAAAFFAR